MQSKIRNIGFADLVRLILDILRHMRDAICNEATINILHGFTETDNATMPNTITSS